MITKPERKFQFVRPKDAYLSSFTGNLQTVFKSMKSPQVLPFRNYYNYIIDFEQVNVSWVFSYFFSIPNRPVFFSSFS